jgi:hypothetical protein
VTCGEGTKLVDHQCRVTGVDPNEAGPADQSEAGPPDSGGQDGNPNGGSPSEAGPTAAEGGDAQSAPVQGPTFCKDGGALDSDPCPTGPVIDCSSSCGNRLPCPEHPHNCTWGADDNASIQLDGTSVATVRTPEGDLPPGACAVQCGEAGADQSAYSFTITSSHRWVKITVPAPWRVVAVDDDLCHPADNHCLLVRNGAMVLAPAACMPARNILVEPITDTASCE